MSNTTSAAALVSPAPARAEGSFVVSVPAYVLGTIEAKMAKMAKRAKRLGHEPPRARVLGHFEARSPSTGRTIDMVRLEASGVRPVVADWAVIGSIVHVTGEDAVLQAAPGETVPEHYRTSGNRCEHCRTARRRKETLILRHADGRTMQIGRNCAADFLGDAAQAKDLVTRWAELAKFRGLFSTSLDDWEAEFGNGGGGSYDPSVLGFLAWCAHAARLRGYAKSVREDATARIVMNVLRDRRCAEKYGLTGPSQEDREMAQKALAWIQELPESERASGYLANLHAASKALTASRKLRGLLASLVGAAYPRVLREQAEAKARAERRATSTAQHVGAVKERIEFSATIERLRAWEGMYGMTTLFVMRDDDGNTLVWFASGFRTSEWAVGDRLTGKGTVKRHGENKQTGEPETVLTRCTLRKVSAAEAA